VGPDNSQLLRSPFSSLLILLNHTFVNMSTQERINEAVKAMRYGRVTNNRLVEWRPEWIFAMGETSFLTRLYRGIDCQTPSTGRLQMVRPRSTYPESEWQLERADSDLLS
jgi:hypothetical protein